MNLKFLDHPNIIKYYGVCYLDNKVTLVLELSPDGALDEVF
jgi:serine/threonine protein kinase